MRRTRCAAWTDARSADDAPVSSCPTARMVVALAAAAVDEVAAVVAAAIGRDRDVACRRRAVATVDDRSIRTTSATSAEIADTMRGIAARMAAVVAAEVAAEEATESGKFVVDIWIGCVG